MQYSIAILEKILNIVLVIRPPFSCLFNAQKNNYQGQTSRGKRKKKKTYLAIDAMVSPYTTTHIWTNVYL
jgi:hypothetical protein